MVGIQKYVYDVFGPAVNLAARLEAVSEPMEIVIDAATHAAIKEDFTCRDRGVHDLKGFPGQQLYTLESETGLRR